MTEMNDSSISLDRTIYMQSVVLQNVEQHLIKHMSHTVVHKNVKKRTILCL